MANDIVWDDEKPNTSGIVWDDEKPQPQTNTLGQELGRQAGLTGRALLTAAASPLVIGGNVIGKAVNAAAGREVFQPSSRVLQQTLTRMGLPEPTRSVEQFTQGVAEAAPAFALPVTLPAQVAGNAAINAALATPGTELGQAALGAGLGAAGQVVGGIVRPTAAAKELLSRGVALTPGQAAGTGSAIKKVEELAASNPVASHFVVGAQRRALEDANMAAAQSVADVVQQRVKLGQPPREAIEQAREMIGKTYDEALLNVSVPLANTANAMTDLLPTIAQRHPLIPEAELARAGKYIDSRFRGLWDNGVRDLTGTQIKQLDSEIGQHIRDLSRSTNAADKTAAPLWMDLQQEVRNRISATIPPEQSAQLNQANAAYRQLLALEKSLLPGADTFTPRRLRATLEKMGIKNTDLNQVANAMGETLPNTVPNSGTAERVIANALPAMLFGGGAGAQAMGYDVIGPGLLAAGALGSRPGARFMTGSLPGQQAVATAFRQSAPALSSAYRQEDAARAEAQSRALRRGNQPD